MQWGLGTITHAHTAQFLWRDGIKDYTLCSNRQRRPRAPAAQQGNQEGLQGLLLPVQPAGAAADSEQDRSKSSGGGLYVDPLLLADDMPTDDGVSSLVIADVATAATGQDAVVASAGVHLMP